MRPDMIVKGGFIGPGHCDRGDYADIAFDPVDEAWIGDMLESAKGVIGQTRTGYKGGTYTIDEFTKVRIGYWGQVGEEIGDIHFRYWMLTGKGVVMVEKTVIEAVQEARRFLKTVDTARKERDPKSWADQYSGDKWTAAIKRASMDLTRKLAELRSGK